MHTQMIELHALSLAMQIACCQIQKHPISICCYIKFPIYINKMLQMYNGSVVEMAPALG